MKLTEVQRGYLRNAAAHPDGLFRRGTLQHASAAKMERAGYLEKGPTILDPEKRATLAVSQRKHIQGAQAALAGDWLTADWKTAYAHLSQAAGIEYELALTAFYITEAGRKAVAEC